MRRRLDRTFESRTSPCRRPSKTRARRRISPHPIHTSLGPPFGRFRVRPSPPSRAHLSRSPADPRVRSTAMASPRRRGRRPRPRAPSRSPAAASPSGDASPSPRAAGRPLAPPAAARLRRSRRGAARSSPRATPAPPPPPRAPAPRAPPRARLLPPPTTTRRASPWTTSCGTRARSRATFASSRAERGTARCATSRT